MQRRYDAPRSILDCDPGIDDALAIAFATAHPRIDLVGITTVAGNVGLAKTTANALAVASFVGANDVPVTAGCPVPLLRPALDAGHVHGDSGLGGAVLPRAARTAEDGHAIDFIIADDRRRARGDHAGRDRPADQHRAGAAPRAAAGRLGQGLRDHGRLRRARQREPRRGVQHLGRPRGGRDRVQRGLDGADDRARRHAAGPGDGRRPGAHALARRARRAAAAAGARAVPGLGRHHRRAAGARRVRDRVDRRSRRRSPTRRRWCRWRRTGLHVRDDRDRLRATAGHNALVATAIDADRFWDDVLGAYGTLAGSIDQRP